MGYFGEIEIDLNKFSDKLGVDVTKKTHEKKYTTARYAVFLLLNMSYRPCQIARLFGYDNSSVQYGINQIKDMLFIKDKLAVEAWEKIKDIEV